MTAVINFGEAPAVDYDPFEHRPDYLIDGPWSKSVGVYAPYLTDGCCHLVFSAGAYDLYEVNVSSMQQIYAYQARRGSGQ
jgi:hypothetical protein